MARQVIVGFDGSEQARDGLALATLLARARDARLVVAYVYLHHPLARHAAAEDDYARYLREDAEARLRQAAELTDDEVEQVAVAAGSVAEGLHRLGEERRADMIVVGSSHVGPVGRVLAGSVPERLMQGAPCAVAIAPKGYAATAPGRLERVAAAWDDLDEADLALATAVEIARAAGAQARAIHVCDAHVPPLMPRPIAEVEWREYRRELRDREVAALEQAAARAGAVAEALDGETIAVLTERSRELDLLVVGSRCYGPLWRVLLGSTTTKLVREVACPLLIVPRGSVDRPRVEQPAAG